MKYKILFTVLLAGMLLFAQPQKAKSYTKSISADPISLIFGMFNVTYEFQTAPQNSWTIFGSYYFPSSSWTVLGAGASYRWYLLNSKKTNIIEGFSFGPKAYISYWGSDISDGGVGFTIGGEAAYKWVFGGFTVEPIFNLLIPLVKYYGNSLNVGIGVNLGYAW